MLPTSLSFEIPPLYKHTWLGDQFILADVQKNRVGGRLIILSFHQQTELLLNSSIWFCDGAFKTCPNKFRLVYIIQCLVGNQMLPALYAFTSNRKRKTYEEIIRIIINLAASRGKGFAVNTIVPNYEDAW
ncbi:unnamed protein product [Adineta steineri]|uniref:MULE transposase domain-containing protein n=1 Tax=Adineta steineri TaxID=433720 RepID=A0A816FN19_9BILA|nr:unnamed protein product [Adineta steineri]CAF1663659.1 unnamed protein product [Adineta steineri]